MPCGLHLGAPRQRVENLVQRQTTRNRRPHRVRLPLDWQRLHQGYLTKTAHLRRVTNKPLDELSTNTPVAKTGIDIHSPYHSYVRTLTSGLTMENSGTDEALAIERAKHNGITRSLIAEQPLREEFRAPLRNSMRTQSDIPAAPAAEAPGTFQHQPKRERGSPCETYDPGSPPACSARRRTRALCRRLALNVPAGKNEHGRMTTQCPR